MARADVAKTRQELKFSREELERTRIVAPVSGRVITPDLNLMVGTSLKSGDIFLEIEKADVIDADIAIPESDIAMIAMGDEVRLKAWGYSDNEIVGTVQAIAPIAEDLGYGKVVRIRARFQNDDDFLRSGMTGYAKVEGTDMRVGEAYLRSIKHFFQIEVWSWIP